MDTVLLSFLSGMFGTFCVGREVVLIVREKRIRISNLFLIMYGVTYGIVLSLLLIFYDTGIYQANGYFLVFDYTTEGLSATAWWFFAAVVGYFSFLFGSRLRFNRDLSNSKPEIEQSKTESRAMYLLQITAILSLLLGIVCFMIWVSGWGGYVNLFLNAAAIRNGTYGIRNPVAFFAKPAQIVATVSIMSMYLIKRKKNVILNGILFIVSFAFSLLYYLAKDGRMVMAMYLLIVLFMAFELFEKQQKIGSKFARLGVAFVLFVVVVLNMDTLTQSLRYNSSIVVEETSALETIMDELAYIYVAGQTSIKHYISEGSPLLIGHDIGSALFAWVPSALTPDGFVNVWDYNTNLVGGGMATAQFPTDLISTSIYDLGVFGPILLPAFWGMVVSKLERIGKNNHSPFVTVLYYSISMTFIRVVNYSMLSAIVASVFHLFVAGVVYWVISHIKIR